MNRYFFGKIAVHISSPYSKEISSKNQKSLELFEKKATNGFQKSSKQAATEWTPDCLQK